MCVGGGVYCVASTIIYIINGVLVPVLFAIAFIVFLWGITKAYILSHGEPEEVSKGHKLILWGIIAFAVMISVWGLVNVVANTFGLGGQFAPPPPGSPYMSAAGGPGGSSTIAGCEAGGGVWNITQGRCD